MIRFTTIIAGALLALAGLAASAAPTTYTIDTTHSRITFYVNHLGFSNSVGEFKLADGSFGFDPDDWSKSNVAVRIPVQSLELGDAKWNAHILSADFLEAAKFPEMSFASTKVEMLDASHGKLYGDLTIKGVTRPVVLDLRLNKIGEHPMRKTRAAGFTATATIKRSEFGVAAYVPAVSDELDVRIEIEAFVANG